MKVSASKPHLSIVIPLFNEAEGIPHLYKALNALKPKLPKLVEIILVDDGSKDATLDLLQKTRLAFSKHIISLSRNFGHQAALFAGLEAAKGDIVVTMDSDLQHPPNLIPKMLEQHQLGYDIVLTKRIDTKEVSWHKKTFSFFFYQIINWLSDTHVPLSSSDFRSMSRRALNSLLILPEKRKFLRGMVAWIGYSSVVLPFTVNARVTGTSKYSVAKMVSLALHGLTSFTVFPLYLSGFFSVGIFILAIIYSIYIIYERLFSGTVVSGWASVLLVLLFLGASITLFLGLIGAYLAAMYEELKNRPFYITKDTYEKGE